MLFLRLTINIAFAIILTALTQIGGIIYLLSRYFYKYINKIITKTYPRIIAKATAFIVLYLVATFLLVPYLAPLFGRVRLPINEQHHIKPLTFITVLLNRNYVKRELRNTTFLLGDEMNAKFPGTTVNYLDGCFPFINKFPLLPHLSHNDGNKLDLAFCYKDAAGNESNNHPSFIGYGICEEALPHEKNTSEFCRQNGYFQYSFLKVIVPQSNKKDFTFDETRTKAMMEVLLEQQSIHKIFIEPHLVSRMKLGSEKLRFHGCQAVRHDDHIHIQL